MRARLRTEIAISAACAAGTLALLGPLIGSFADGLWGPDLPWLHRDFLGAWWLFHAADIGEALAQLHHPDGSLPLAHHIPNPFDGLLLGPLVARVPFPLWWNVLQLGHHLGNVVGTAVLARAAGLRPSAAIAAGLLVAGSPVMLHEIAGGRTLSGAAWPGLLGLAALLRQRDRTAGLLIGLQGLCYLYTGLLFGLAALALRPRRGLAWAALPLAPYLLWLLPVAQDLSGAPPPAGHTALPLAGLLGLAVVPEKFRLNPLLLTGLLAALRPGGRRWLMVALLAGLVAVGPAPGWSGAGDVSSPVAWLMWAIPGLDRMHHPVRAAFLLVPALAVMCGHLIDAIPRRDLRILTWSAALPLVGALRLAAAHDVGPEPPGADAARWLAAHAEAAVDLTGAHGEALGLQPIHGLPMLEGLRVLRPAPGRRAANLRADVDAWWAGEARPGLPEQLRQAGFSHVLVVERRGPVDVTAIEAALGPPVFPGVYALP